TTTASSSSSSSSPSSKSHPQAQTLSPISSITNAITSPITNSQLLKDLGHLLQMKSGELPNLTVQNLDNLKHDLTLSPPSNVASHLAVQHPTGTGTSTGAGSRVSAETLADPPSTAGNPLPLPAPVPAPIPEPSTLVFVALVLGAWGLRLRLGSR